jgi:hypothetical protein
MHISPMMSVCESRDRLSHGYRLSHDSQTLIIGLGGFILILRAIQQAGSGPTVSGQGR